MTRGLLVELCGLPGAGKSTLTEQLTGALAASGLPNYAPSASTGPDVARARRIPRKIALCAGQVLAHPATSLRLSRRIVLAARAGQEAGARHVAARFVPWAITQRTFSRARGVDGVHIYEEGLIQALWSMSLRGDVSPVLLELDRRSRDWIRPDLVVVVNVPVDIAAVRLRRRPSSHSRTQLLSCDEQLRELRRGERNLELLIQWFRGVAGPADVLAVSGIAGLAHPSALSPVLEHIVTVAAERGIPARPGLPVPRKNTRPAPSSGGNLP